MSIGPLPRSTSAGVRVHWSAAAQGRPRRAAVPGSSDCSRTSSIRRRSANGGIADCPSSASVVVLAVGVVIWVVGVLDLDPSAGGELITTGPYAVVKHPYTAVGLLVLPRLIPPTPGRLRRRRHARIQNVLDRGGSGRPSTTFGRAWDRLHPGRGSRLLGQPPCGRWSMAWTRCTLTGERSGAVRGVERAAGAFPRRLAAPSNTRLISRGAVSGPNPPCVGPGGVSVVERRTLTADPAITDPIAGQSLFRNRVLQRTGDGEGEESGLVVMSEHVPHAGHPAVQENHACRACRHGHRRTHAARHPASVRAGDSPSGRDRGWREGTTVPGSAAACMMRSSGHCRTTAPFSRASGQRYGRDPSSSSANAVRQRRYRDRSTSAVLQSPARTALR